MANKRQLLDRLQSALDTMKKGGATYAEAAIVIGSSLSVSVRGGELVSLKSNSHKSQVILTAHIGDRQSETAPDTQRPELLQGAIHNMLGNMRELTPNPHARPVDRTLLSKIRTHHNLDLYDKAKPDTQTLIEGALTAERAALAVPSIKLCEQSSSSWREKHMLALTSAGDVFVSKTTINTLVVSTVSEKKSGMESAYDYTYARHRADMKDPAHIGRSAGEKAAKALNAITPPKSGKLPVFLDQQQSAGLIEYFTHAAMGMALFRKESFLSLDHIGQKVFASGITIHDTPHKKRGLASGNYDDNGLPTRPETFVKDGVLQNIFLGVESARRLNRPLTDITGGPTNLSVLPGTATPDDLMSGVKDGFYVTGVMGHSVDVHNGDYSLSAKGFWVKNGRLGRPIAKATIAGNLRDIFMNITPANDLDEGLGEISCPTLRVDGMTVS